MTTDPTTIDLRRLKINFPPPMDIPTEEGLVLIAAVEALRERVGELEETSKYWMNEATADKNGAGARITWKDRAEAAEAINKDMAEALQEARPVVFNAIDQSDQSAKHETRRRILGVVGAVLKRAKP